MTEPRHCTAPGCGKLLVKRYGERGWLQRNTCDHACRQNKQNAISRAYREAAKQLVVKLDPLGWPYVTGPIETDFRPFNEEPGDRQGYLPLRPGTLVKTQSSIA